MKMPGYVFEGEINGARIENLLRVLRRESSVRQALFVDSPGGQFEFFSTLAPPIARLGVTTIALNVKSAAVILYLLGHRRYALPNAEFLFHEVRTFIDGQVITVGDLNDMTEYSREFTRKTKQTNEYMEQWHNQMRMAQEWMINFVCDSSGVDVSVIRKLIRDDTTLTAKEALNYGIVEKIVDEDYLMAHLARHG